MAEPAGCVDVGVGRTVVDHFPRLSPEIVVAGGVDPGLRSDVLTHLVGELGRREDVFPRRLVEQQLEFIEVLFVDVPRVGVVLLAQARCPAEHFAHQPAGGHHADRAQCLVCYADIAAGHHQVGNVPRVEAAIGDRIGVFLEAGEFGVGDERIPVPAGSVLGIGIMEVDRPGGGHAAVGELAAFQHVVLGEDHVAQQPPRLPFARDRGRPGEPVVRVELLDVLQRVPGAEHGAEVVVADGFRLADGVLIEAAFPKPLAQPVELGGKRSLGEVQSPRASRERSRAAGILQVPHVAGAEVTFGRHLPVGPGQESDGGVTRRVDKPSAREAGLAPRDDVPARHRLDPRPIHLHLVDVLREPQVQVLFCFDDFQLEVVAIVFGRSRADFRTGEELGHNLADDRIGRLVDAAVDPHPNLGAAIASQHGPVLDKGHLQPQSGRRYGRTAARHPAADHHDVEPAPVVGLVGETERLLAKRGQRFRLARRSEARVVGQ